MSREPGPSFVIPCGSCGRRSAQNATPPPTVRPGQCAWCEGALEPPGSIPRACSRCQHFDPEPSTMTVGPMSGGFVCGHPMLRLAESVLLVRYREVAPPPSCPRRHAAAAEICDADIALRNACARRAVAETDAEVEREDEAIAATAERKRRAHALREGR